MDADLILIVANDQYLKIQKIQILQMAEYPDASLAHDPLIAGLPVGHRRAQPGPAPFPFSIQSVSARFGDGLVDRQSMDAESCLQIKETEILVDKNADAKDHQTNAPRLKPHHTTLDSHPQQNQANGNGHPVSHLQHHLGTFGIGIVRVYFLTFSITHDPGPRSNSDRIWLTVYPILTYTRIAGAE